MEILGDLEYLPQLMLLGGLCRWVDVLEPFGLVDELFERASIQMAHARSRRLLDFFNFVEHASFHVAHA